MAKAAAKKAPKKGFEEILWDTANKLRGSVESSEYKHIVLSLIFRKFISDKFETQKARIESEYGADFVDMVDFYTWDNVFYLPETSRWLYVLQHAKQNDIAEKIDSACKISRRTTSSWPVLCRITTSRASGWVAASSRR